MKKSILFVFAIILSMILFSFAVFAEENSPAVLSGFDGGSGTVDAPYLINNVDQLKNLAENVKNNDCKNTYFSFTSDIGSKETPVDFMIGSTKNPFSGNLNGNGHVIFTELESTENNVGLFVQCRGASISHLTVCGKVKGNMNVGCVAGAAHSSSFIGCVNKAEITAEWYGGGICGYVSEASLITDCKNTGEIYGGTCCGGIFGYCEGSEIKNSVSFGEVSTQAKIPAVGLFGGNAAKTNIISCFCEKRENVSDPIYTKDKKTNADISVLTAEECKSQEKLSALIANQNDTVVWTVGEEGYPTPAQHIHVWSELGVCSSCGKQKCALCGHDFCDEVCTVCKKSVCEINGHSWKGGFCTVCGVKKCSVDGQHDFSGDVCSLCGKTKCEINGHSWSGNECSVCHKTKCEDSGHDWKNNVCQNCRNTKCEIMGHDWKNGKCSRCGILKCELSGHDWKNGKCTICNVKQCEIMGHNWVDGKCTICNKATESEKTGETPKSDILISPAPEKEEQNADDVKTPEQTTGEPEVDQKELETATVYSSGNMWIVICIAEAAVFTGILLVVLKKKKQ